MYGPVWPRCSWRTGAITLFETQLAPSVCDRHRNRVRRVRRRWMVHLRGSPVLLKSFVRLLPGRKFCTGLYPVNHSGFVTPVEQAPHRWPMRFREHKSLHRALRRPACGGPVGVPSIRQQFDREVAVGPRGLPDNSHRLNHEGGQVGPRSNAETRDGDERHAFFLSSE